MTFVVRSIGAAILALACVQPAVTAQRADVDPGTFQLNGDPESASGAAWTFRGKFEGTNYDLTGVLMKPHGTGPFGAVILSHGAQGSAAGLSQILGPTMVKWGLVSIATNYTHSEGVPIGAPGGANDRGASDANVQRLHMTRELLRRLGYVDMARIALHGHSMGAYLGVRGAGKYPKDFLVASTTGGGIRPDRVMAGPAPTSGQADGIRIPFQLHHGDADETVPLEYDKHLASVLESHHVPEELFVYPGGHLVPRSSPLMLERVHAWYEKYGMFGAR